MTSLGLLALLNANGQEAFTSYLGAAQWAQTTLQVPYAIGAIALVLHAIIVLYLLSHMSSVVFRTGQQRYNAVSNILRSLVAFVALALVVAIPLIGEIVWYHEYGASLIEKIFNLRQNDTQQIRKASPSYNQPAVA